MDELRNRIGVKIERSLEPCVTRLHEIVSGTMRMVSVMITRYGMIQIYASATEYGDIIAPPSFIFACSRIISGYVGGLPGVHAMFAGCDFDWYAPIPRNSEIVTEAYLKDLVEHETSFAGRSVQQTYHVDFFDKTGKMLASGDSWCFRTDRDLLARRVLNMMTVRKCDKQH